MNTTAISPRSGVGSAQVLGRGFNPSMVPEATPIVFILDEDASICESLELLIRAEGWHCETFASAKQFFTCPLAFVPNCLVLDASLPGPNALELQKRVAIDRPGTPIIFIAGRIDVPTTVKAMKAGAVELFIKPFPEAALLSSVPHRLAASVRI